MQFRRRVPRQPAGWDGVCQIEGEFAARCRIIDISMLGVGLTLDHPSPYALVGRRISVDIPAVGDSASLRLEGKVANAKLTLRTSVRLGIAFDRPSPEVVENVGGHARVGARRIRVR
jgi:PilZ domain-containing protein